jgi:hypothetical protein
MASPMLDAQIVQAASHLHHLIRDAVLGIAQHVLHNTTPLDSGQGMLDPYPDARQFAIGLLFVLRQFALRWFFFGM